MLYPSQKKKVPMAYSGMSLDAYTGGVGSQMTEFDRQSMVNGANSRIGARIAGTAAQPKAVSPATSAVSGSQIAGAAGAAIQGVAQIGGIIKESKVDTQSLIATTDDKVAYGAKPNVGKA